MSKILRRPMFRGGPVNSEGTGITFGLDEGYATGGSVIPKRGLVDGPGGYAGDDIFGSEFEKGADIYSQTEREKGSLLSDLLESGSIEKKQQEAIDQLNKEAESYKKYKSPMGWGPQPGADKRFGGVRPDISESIYVQDAINKAKYAETPEGQNKILQNLLAQQRQQAEKYTQLYGTKGEKSPFVQNILNKGKGGEDDNLVNRELKNQNEISMDDIEARTEKYAKLLGYDKAKTQSIYDAMLAASPAFFKGRSFGETASGVLEAVNKS